MQKLLAHITTSKENNYFSLLSPSQWKISFSLFYVSLSLYVNVGLYPLLFLDRWEYLMTWTTEVPIETIANCFSVSSAGHGAKSRQASRRRRGSDDLMSWWAGRERKRKKGRECVRLCERKREREERVIAMAASFGICDRPWVVSRLILKNSFKISFGCVWQGLKWSANQAKFPRQWINLNLILTSRNNVVVLWVSNRTFQVAIRYLKQQTVVQQYSVSSWRRNKM